MIIKFVKNNQPAGVGCATKHYSGVPGSARRWLYGCGLPRGLHFPVVSPSSSSPIFCLRTRSKTMKTLA